MSPAPAPRVRVPVRDGELWLHSDVDAVGVVLLLDLGHPADVGLQDLRHGVMIVIVDIQPGLDREPGIPRRFEFLMIQSL